jgi:hypothetical protein
MTSQPDASSVSPMTSQPNASSVSSPYLRVLRDSLFIAGSKRELEALLDGRADPASDGHPQ